MPATFDVSPLLRQHVSYREAPVLPIIPYDTLDEVIYRVNGGERPLALYVYAQDPKFSDLALSRTTSGGACVNRSLLHGAIAALPFGGIGNSGMGRHHGIEEFREFSNPRGVFIRGEGIYALPTRTLLACTMGAAALTSTDTAAAHHSFAMYDREDPAAACQRIEPH